MSKVILISQYSLPHSKIGSWTTMYKNYLESTHNIDYIICPEPDSLFDNVKYGITKNSLSVKIKKKLTGSNYISYFDALDKIINPSEKYIIQIVDNFGIVKPLSDFLQKKNIRKSVYLQFFYHGYPPFFENFRGRWFFETIDQMVLLTFDSYKAHKDYYTILPTRFSVLHNGIDTSKFYSVSDTEKDKLKKEFNVSDKKVFVWCSQDRPKKGLFLILDVWKRIYKKYPNTELWVIGTETKQSLEGVRFFGRIPNNELPKYFQAADSYLFPTLWHEGFGLSLIEALHCGNYCIASALGGVPEVLRYGKFGKLIEKPHFIQDWVDAIEDYLENSPKFEPIPYGLYSKERWNNDMDEIIESAKKNL